MNDYSPTPTPPNYMTSDWGNQRTQETALRVDFIADKANLAIENLESALTGMDAIEKEIIDISNATVMPSRETIRAFAYRIDAQQKQLQLGLDKLKNMMKDIDETTNTIQRPHW
jgi:hypothetical protein